MKTAIKLCEYDDILNPRYIYSLLCLAALKNKFYGICSKAFVKVSAVLFCLYVFGVFILLLWFCIVEVVFAEYRCTVTCPQSVCTIYFQLTS